MKVGLYGMGLRRLIAVLLGLLSRAETLRTYSFGVDNGSPLWIKEIGMETASTPAYRSGEDFQPYANNGGTVVAVAGEDFCIIAADSRLSDVSTYSILSRNVTRVHQLSDKTFLATAGCWADTQGLIRLLRYLIRDYESQHSRPLGTTAASRMLSTHLYYRRGFPFYTFNLVCGLDSQGVGAVYGYDAIGSFERASVASAGGGQSLVQPILDRLDAAPTRQAQGGKEGTPEEYDGRGDSWGPRLKGGPPVVAACLDEALQAVKTVFTAAGEREISLGDEVEIVVVTREGLRRERVQLNGH